MRTKLSARFAVPALLLLALLVPVPLPAQKVTTPPKDYAAAVKDLEAFIAAEVAEKQLPSLAIALVDDQQVVWAKGFGEADPDNKKEATPKTLYRVGSVSKPFTALLLMLLMEAGLVDLDVPVSQYLPEFKPKNPFSKKITLRQMLSHHSGLVRELPVGNYFDDTNPTLAATVKSLNQTTLVYPPESKYSYSNAAVAVIGYVIEQLEKKPFAKVMQEKLLDPIGMTDSSFDPAPAQRKHLARALMWTYHGREFPAPTFDLGMAPAGSLYSNADDMGKFLKFLFAGGQGAKGQILKSETLQKMWVPPFPEKDGKSGYGLGCAVSQFKGKRRIGHGGAVYGFATTLAALPDDKLGVIVMAAKDVANAVTNHIAEVALERMLAVRQNKPLPPIVRTFPVDKAQAVQLAGRYQSGKKVLELIESQGKLYYLPHWIGLKIEVRREVKPVKGGPDAVTDVLITDGLLGYGTKIKVEEKGLRIDKELFERMPESKPQPVPEKWVGLIGEYGWDYNTLYILEKDGQLYALIEWITLYPLKEIGKDTYQFPDFGMYHGDKVIFFRDANGKATKVDAGSVMFHRRAIKGEGGELFTIKPLYSLDKLRKDALAATPPAEKKYVRKPELVDLTGLDSTIKLDIRYAGKKNFLETPFYTTAKAYMQKPAAEALARVQKNLAKQGYGLLIYDAYRPWHVTKMFWDATPDKFKNFVADPKKGSRHNRGCAVDLTLYDLKTGQPVEMVSGYDEFSDRAYADYLGGTSLQRWHRGLLRKAMEDEGFTVYSDEWWHFDYRDWPQYGLLNLTFEEIAKQKE
jgi:serine beta-lactamase-like protein LACTB